MQKALAPEISTWPDESPQLIGSRCGSCAATTFPVQQWCPRCSGGEMTELRLRNISSMGALVDCSRPVAPGDEMTIDIVGVGPVHGRVRWAQTGKFGIQFADQFDLGRLAPVKEKPSNPPVASPWLKGKRAAS